VINYVDVEALNFRSQPVAAGDNRIGILHLGQSVDRLGDGDAEGWAKIRAAVDGASRDGFVSSRFLRPPVSDAREELVAQAITQWLRFAQGLGQEFDDPFAGFVGEMWQAIGLDLDGRDRDVPWSAAAISLIVRNAGKRFAHYHGFRFAAAHARYLHDAIVRRQRADTSAPFWGFRLHEKRPELGDMVCRWRETPRSFDDAVTSDAFKSHCDIIVQIMPDEVLAIGGNVGNSVSITRYDKTPGGFLADSKGVFAHLVNRVE